MRACSETVSNVRVWAETALSEADWKLLHTCSFTSTHAKGDALYTEGTPVTDAIYLVREGSIKYVEHFDEFSYAYEKARKGDIRRLACDRVCLK